jgi:penicillin-insensitive murein endopeptidase
MPDLRKLALILAVCAAPVQANEWHALSKPVAGPPRVIGSPANGCIAGAVSMPTEGEGYQAIRLSRSRHFAHPETVDYVRDLGRRAASQGLGLLQIGDLGQARGGPMPWGHASHQNGLDVDVWFELDVPSLPVPAREGLELASMVDREAKRVDPARFSARQIELLRLAAQDPRVNRIFVAPPIKLALCERVGTDREWLRLVRPWFGHEAHFHVRLRPRAHVLVRTSAPGPGRAQAPGSPAGSAGRLHGASECPLISRAGWSFIPLESRAGKVCPAGPSGATKRPLCRPAGVGDR